MNDSEAHAFLEQAFKTLFDQSSTEDDVLKFFSPDYQQDLNGKMFTFRQFMEGVDGLKEQLASIDVRFTSVVSSGDKIAEIHVVRATKKDGGSLRFKVMAFQTIADGRITRAEELNCTL